MPRHIPGFLPGARASRSSALGRGVGAPRAARLPSGLMFLAPLARAARRPLISRGFHTFSAGAGVDRLASLCATRRLLCVQAQPAQTGEADETSPRPQVKAHLGLEKHASRPSMTARARWQRMDAALKIVAAEGCSLEEAEARVWEKAVEENGQN